MHHTPSLWAYICSDHPREPILECLARSGQAPLHISLNAFDLYRQELRTKIFREVHQWKTVEMSGMIVGGFEELEQRPALLLEKFCIRYRRDIRKAFNLFHGIAARLRHLSLFNIRIPWESDLLSRLRTLEISNNSYGPTTQQVVNALRLCPDLTTFKLQLPPGLHPGPMPLAASTIDLPQLGHLSIRVHPLMTEDLLRLMHIPTCRIFDVNQVKATGPTLSAGMEGLIPGLSSILLAVDEKEYFVDGCEEEEKEKENGGVTQCISIQASGDQFTSVFGFETLTWLLDKVHTPSFSLPVLLRISGITSSQVITPTIDRLSFAIASLELALDDVSSAKTIISYLSEPFEVDVDGTTTLRWPLPNLTYLSFEWCKDLEPEIILACVQRRAGCGLSSRGGCEHHEELPPRLARLCLPRQSSSANIMRMFPDCMEWCGLDLGSVDRTHLEGDIFGDSDTGLSDD
ncbi:hypothetical protein FRB93_013535 [Tulasnella sp. JGI-2019a]|nr:hypothetical protein FRB93_013535 [Tulasnella sp. JGI-2019a]